MNPRPNELLGDSRAELVYLPPNAARRRNSNVPSTNSDLQNKKDEDSPPVTNVSLQKERFPPVDKLKFVQDRAFIYVVEVCHCWLYIVSHKEPARYMYQLNKYLFAFCIILLL